MRAESLDVGKKLDKTKKAVRTWLQKNGTADDNGNLIYVFPDPVDVLDGKEYAGVMLRKSQGSPYLEEDEVREFLERKFVSGTEHAHHSPHQDNPLLRRAFRTVEVLDPDELYVMQQEGIITEEELRGLLHDPAPSYALWPYDPAEELEDD